MTNISPGDWLEKNVANSFRHMFFQVPFLKIDLEKSIRNCKRFGRRERAHRKKKGRMLKTTSFSPVKLFSHSTRPWYMTDPDGYILISVLCKWHFTAPGLILMDIASGNSETEEFFGFLQPSTTSAYSSAIILLTFITLFFYPSW